MKGFVIFIAALYIISFIMVKFTEDFSGPRPTRFWKKVNNIMKVVAGFELALVAYVCWWF